METPVWTFLGSRPANWWVRRRLHEATVHRADAAIALGRDFTLAPELAADAISEWLERVAIQAGRGDAPLPLEDGQTLHLHATDPGSGRSRRMDDPRRRGAHRLVTRHGKGAWRCAAAPPTCCWPSLRRVRVADTGIEVFGDDRVWQNWLDHTPF